MIAVSSMMVADVLSQVEALSGTLITQHNVDWKSLINYLRDARRDLFLKTHAYMEWAFHSSLDVVNGTAVPQDFIRPVRLVVWELGGTRTDNAEARRVDPREWLALLQTGPSMSFTSARLSAPVYMIWANQTDSVNWASTQMQVWLAPANAEGRLEYLASYADAGIVESDDPVLIPVALESLLVDMTLERLLMDVADGDRLSAVRARVMEGLAQYSLVQAAVQTNEALTLDSVPTPEPTRTIPVEGGR